MTNSIFVWVCRNRHISCIDTPSVLLRVETEFSFSKVITDDDHLHTYIYLFGSFTFPLLVSLQLIRGLAGNPPAQGLPPIQEYIECAEQRQQTIVRYGHGNGDLFRGVRNIHPPQKSRFQAFGWTHLESSHYIPRKPMLSSWLLETGFQTRSDLCHSLTTLSVKLIDKKSLFM